MELKMRLSVRWIVVILVGMNLEAHARPVTSYQLNQIVQSLVRAVAVPAGTGLNKVTLPSIERVDVLLQSDGSVPLAQIVHLRPAGFVVVAADDRIGPVIAYSFQESWNGDTSAANTLLQFVKKDLSDRLAKFTRTDPQATQRSRILWENGYGGASEYSTGEFLQWPAVGTTTSGGWVETEWDQNAPFNKFCPLDPVTHRRSVVGCVATAFAQLLNYHRSLGALSFDSTDSYSAGGIAVDGDSTKLRFPSLRQLNEYVVRINDAYRIGMPLSDTLQAALSFACGVLVKMEYGWSASASHDSRIVSALESRLKWPRPLYVGLPEQGRASMIKNCMNGFPSLLGIYGSSGHLVIVDGFNTEGFFHLNFGWGAYNPSTVWYSLPNGIPQWCESSIVTDIAPVETQSGELISDLRHMYFACTPPHVPSQPRRVTIANRTSQPVPLLGLKVTRGFQISADSLTFGDGIMASLVPASGEFSFYVRSMPDTLGRIDGTILVLAGSRSCAITLSGAGGEREGTLIVTHTVSGVWDQQSSPYYIFNHIDISGSEKLVILPGTEICFMGPYKILIQSGAQIIARGTRESPIVFSASDTTRGWQHLFINHRSSKDTLQWCIFKHGNMVDNSDFYHDGGAIYTREADLLVDECVIEHCRAFTGGGIYAEASQVTIRNTVIRNNYAEEQGGGIAVGGGKMDITNTIIAQNSAKNIAAGISATHNMWGGAPALVRVINSVVADNDGRVVDPNVGPAAELRVENARVDVLNSIIWNNTPSVHPSILLIDTGYVQFSFSNVDTTSSGWLRYFAYRATCDPSQVSWTNGNKCIDPQFTDPAEGDYTLHISSPCIDAGDPGEQYQDQADSSRPSFAQWPALGTRRNDMGAYGGRRPLPRSPTAVASEKGIPQGFTLFPNFPNPFNPSTSIRFSFPTGATCDYVFNQFGQEVSDLVNDVREAGARK